MQMLRGSVSVMNVRLLVAGLSINNTPGLWIDPKTVFSSSEKLTSAAIHHLPCKPICGSKSSLEV